MLFDRRNPRVAETRTTDCKRLSDKDFGELTCNVRQVALLSKALGNAYFVGLVQGCAEEAPNRFQGLRDSSYGPQDEGDQKGAVAIL